MDFSNPDLKELACLIYETLKNSGINSVLVGGACVSIYSHNRYQSSDLDFATYEEMKPIENALTKLGFKRKGLEQALMVAEDHLIDLQDLKRWAKKEGFEKKLEEFLCRRRKPKR